MLLISLLTVQLQTKVPNMAYGSIKSISDSILESTDGESIQEQIDAYMQSTTSGTTNDGVIANAAIRKDTGAIVKSLGARAKVVAEPAVVIDRAASVTRDWTALMMANDQDNSAINAAFLSDEIAANASSAPETTDEAFLQTGVLPAGGDTGNGLMSSLRPEARPAGLVMSSLRPEARPAGLAEQDAKAIQRSLGFTGTAVDGDFGPGSIRALASFQFKAGLPVSGQIDDATRDALENPDSTDPRNAKPRISVLNDAGDAPDMSKVKAWAKKNIADPLKAAAFVSTVESETGGRSLIEEGRHFSRLLGRNRTPAEIAKKLGGNTARRKAFNDLSTNPDYINGDTAKKDAMVFDIFYDDQYRGTNYKLGNVNLGDGSKYKGRGLVQITGRSNYKKIGDLIGVDFIKNPELINDPRYAAAAAMAYLSLGGKNFFVGEVTQDSLAKTVGHSDDSQKTEAKSRFDRAIVLQSEMYP